MAEHSSASGPSWYERAACRGLDVALFFPEVGHAGVRRVAAAKQVCERCSVSGECLAAALALGQQHGVWGGMTPRERQRLARA